MSEKLKDNRNFLKALCEAAILLGTVGLIGTVGLFAFASVQRQTAANEALLHELIGRQTFQTLSLQAVTNPMPNSISTGSTSGETPVENDVAVQPKTGSVLFEHHPEIELQVNESADGIYITSLYLLDHATQEKRIVSFELREEDGSSDSLSFSLQGHHLIGRRLDQTSYSLQLSTSLNDGDLLTVPLNVHVPRSPMLVQAKPAPDSAKTTRSIAPIFTPEIQHWNAEIVEWGETHRLDPDIIATLMQIESCGNPAARSGVGAQGLFQVMPHHFAAGENMFAPNLNAQRALAYFKQGLDTHSGDIYRTFAGYNAGHGTVRLTPIADWPKETQQYHYWSQGIYLEAKAGGETSETLQEWLAFGGASLCQDAAENLGI